ncbi:unnamed protein product, partial [Scytosiphon promiscuus]
SASDAWDGQGTNLPGRGRVTDSPVTPSGLWDVPTTAPSLAELEFQLRQLSPLRKVRTTAANKSRLGGGSGAAAAAGSRSKSPALKSGRGGTRPGLRSSGGAVRVVLGGARSRSSDEGGRRGRRPEGGDLGGATAGARGGFGHRQSLSREGIA